MSWNCCLFFLYLSILIMFLFVLCYVIELLFIFLYLSVLIMFLSVLCYIIELLFMFFVFVNFNNFHVCFVFRHVQFFAFANFSNAIQVLVMYLNLRVYLVVFCLYRLSISSLILCASGYLYFSILVMFFKCILTCECTCLFLSSL